MHFIYKGNIINDIELTIEKILYKSYKLLNEMNVLVKEIKKIINSKNKIFEDKINYKFSNNPNLYKLDIKIKMIFLHLMIYLKYLFLLKIIKNI